MRFDNSIWEQKRIGNILKIQNGKDQKEIETSNGKYNIYGTGGIIGKTNTFLYDKESVGIGRKGTIDKPFYFSEPFWTVDTLFWSKIFKGFIPKFVYFLFQTIDWKKLNQSTGVPSLTSHVIEHQKVYVPNCNYQAKLAYFLDLIDRKILLQERKISILKKYKRGLQKAIFKNKNINKYQSLRTIVTFERKSDYAAGDSVDEGKYVLYKSGQKNGFINSFSHNGIYIIANDGGEACFKLANGKFAYTDHCICFKCKNDNMTIVLCNYLQMLERKITYVGFIGTGLKNIDRQYFGMIKVPTLDYEKIAKTFVDIDSKIVFHQSLLECLISMKKTLLNNLFI